MSIFKRFARDARGGTAMVFAISIVPMLLIGGVAVDYGRATSAATNLKAASDAAALAAASLPYDPDAASLRKRRKAIAKQEFDANIGRGDKTFSASLSRSRN